MQHRIQQHGSVAGGKNEAVSIRPKRIARIVAQELLPQAVGDLRHTYRRAWMAGIGGLNSVNRKSTNSVDAKRLHRCGGFMKGRAGTRYAHFRSFSPAWNGSPSRSPSSHYFSPKWRGKKMRNQDGFKSGHWQSRLQLGEENPLEYDARHAVKCGCKESIAIILNPFSSALQPSLAEKGEPCQKSASLSAPPKTMPNKLRKR